MDPIIFHNSDESLNDSKKNEASSDPLDLSNFRTPRYIFDN
jgi:hypothetical protein